MLRKRIRWLGRGYGMLATLLSRVTPSAVQSACFRYDLDPGTLESSILERFNLLSKEVFNVFHRRVRLLRFYKLIFARREGIRHFQLGHQ